MATNSSKDSDQKTKLNNTGFTTRVLSHDQRLLKKDGSFNIEVRGLPWFRPADAFQHLIKMSWLKFILIVFATYIAVNTFFALLYYAIGTENLTNSTGGTGWKRFLDAFFFSSQSLTTVGYGRVAPISVAASTLAAFESMIGLLGFALATGLLYGRFSRPNAKILNSKNILMAPHGDGTALMFRIANKRESQLVDVEIQVTLKRNTVENGNEVRQFIPLVLESNRLNMFPLSWTLVHPVNEKSPLWGKTLNDFINEDMEVLIYFKAYDETFSNSVHFRLSYKATELVWGAKFILNFEEVAGGPTIHHLNRVSDYEKAELPEHHPSELQHVTT